MLGFIGLCITLGGFKVIHWAGELHDIYIGLFWSPMARAVNHKPETLNGIWFPGSGLRIQVQFSWSGVLASWFGV